MDEPAAPALRQHFLYYIVTRICKKFGLIGSSVKIRDLIGTRSKNARTLLMASFFFLALEARALIQPNPNPSAAACIFPQA